MNDFYFKILVEGADTYSCFTAKDHKTAVRNALFACFSYLQDKDSKFKLTHPNVEDRYRILYTKYRMRIQDTTKEIFEQEDQYQNE